VAGHKVGPGFAVDAATKFGVRALSEGLRQEVKPYNIRTTVISPGAVATELLDSVTDPDAAARVRAFYADAAIPAASFARLVAFAITQPDPAEVTKTIMATANCAEDAVSVCIEDVAATDWTEKVYKPDIIWNADRLYKKPGYDPV
jgi:NADP-dependent 3-hydroxy acid dehydrogenase YdfG